MVLFTLFLHSGCATPAPTKVVIDAPYTKQAIKVDGSAADKVWTDQEYVTIRRADGRTVSMKAAYSEKGINLLFKWRDATKDDCAPVWEFDGQAWMKTGFQDEIAVFWNIDDSVAEFAGKGCAVVCHHENGTSYMATNRRKESLDTWIWTAGASNPYGYMLDDKLDDTVVKGDVTAAFKAESGDPGFVFNENESAPPQVERRPIKKLREGLTVENTPYPTVSQMTDITSFAAFAAGAKEPTVFFTSPPAGDTGDVNAKAVWKDSYWTMEVMRKLDTEQSGDIKFAPAAGRIIYGVFAMAIFEEDGQNKNHLSFGPASIGLMPK